MIIQIPWLMHKFLDRRLVISSVLTITLGFNQAVLAEYQPPADQRPPTVYTDSSGTRGRCEIISERSLTLLAPFTHVGQTTSTHPTFAWFIRDYQRIGQPISMEFSLHEIDVNRKSNKLTYHQVLQSSPGIVKLSLPRNLPGLTVGKRYLWQVEILCDRNRPSRNLLASTEIEVVPTPSTLQTALSATSEHRTQKANLYAKAGMWYDALREALPPSSRNKLGTIAKRLLKDLAQLEKSAQKTNLMQIAK